MGSKVKVICVQVCECCNGGDMHLDVVASRLTWLINKMLSYRRETALPGAFYFSPKVEQCNWETIF